MYEIKEVIEKIKKEKGILYFQQYEDWIYDYVEKIFSLDGFSIDEICERVTQYIAVPPQMIFISTDGKVDPIKTEYGNYHIDCLLEYAKKYLQQHNSLELSQMFKKLESNEGDPSENRNEWIAMFQKYGITMFLILYDPIEGNIYGCEYLGNGIFPKRDQVVENIKNELFLQCEPHIQSWKHGETEYCIDGRFAFQFEEWWNMQNNKSSNQLDDYVKLYGAKFQFDKEIIENGISYFFRYNNRPDEIEKRLEHFFDLPPQIFLFSKEGEVYYRYGAYDTPHSYQVYPLLEEINPGELSWELEEVLLERNDALLRRYLEQNEYAIAYIWYDVNMDRIRVSLSNFSKEKSEKKESAIALWKENYLEKGNAVMMDDIYSTTNGVCYEIPYASKELIELSHRTK